jgi:tetratricopeptide (TPR) repeat protein
MRNSLFFTRYLFPCLLIITIVIYYPGLNSRFLLDDHYNLAQLDLIDSQGYIHYVLSGFAGPSGRPLSLFSFVLQYQDWPHNPFAFKLVNLCIHLVNGILIFFICRLLASELKYGEEYRNAIGILTSALWLLHPMQISTVLYTVQRMTELSALFTLLGIYGYLRIRTLCKNTYPHRHLVTMGFIIAICTLLAILSKENGILLPLYILVLEATFFSGHPRTTVWRIWIWVILVLPLLLVAFYFISILDDTLLSYRNRHFTPGERLLTQAVILFDYIRYLILPHPDAFSLFHDDFPVSTGLLSPPVTLISITGIVSLLLFAIFNRQRFIVISFSILWFFSGHLLESSHLNLELYFEHRNYLPSIGIFFLAAWLSIFCWKRISNKLLISILISSYYLLILTVTIVVINTWSNPVKQAVEWARLHPGSSRALDNLAGAHLILGEYDVAMKTYQRINTYYPDDIYPHIKIISITYCIKETTLTNVEWSEILERAARAKPNGLAAISELDTLILQIRHHNCAMQDIISLGWLVITLATNPEFDSHRGNLHELAATLSIYLADGPSALNNINESLAVSPSPTRYALKIKILMAMNRLTEAETVLQEFRQYLDNHPRYKIGNTNVIETLEGELRSYSTGVN